MYVRSPSTALAGKERLHPTTQRHSRWLSARAVHALEGIGLVTVLVDDLAQVLVGDAVYGAVKNATLATAVPVAGADSAERCFHLKASSCRASLKCMRNRTQ